MRLARALEDQPAGHAGEDPAVVGRGDQATVAIDEEVRGRAFEDGAALVDEDGLVRERRARIVEGEDAGDVREELRARVRTGDADGDGARAALVEIRRRRAKG